MAEQRESPESSKMYVEFNLGGGNDPEELYSLELGQTGRPSNEEELPGQFEEKQDDRIEENEAKQLENELESVKDRQAQGSLKKSGSVSSFSDSSSDLFEGEGEWQEMETVANHYDVYDDSGNLINGTEKREKAEKSAPSSRGYTRIAIQAQAESYAQTDKQTDFLFRADNVEPRYEESSLSSDEDEDDYIDESTRTALDQMQTTKRMLKEEEIFAYVGLAKLVLIEMATDLAQLGTSSYKNSKILSALQASLAVWSQKVMERLYDHMDLSEEERQMVENLSYHGVEVSDLARSLAKDEEVDNPVFGEEVEVVELGKENEEKKEKEERKEKEEKEGNKDNETIEKSPIGLGIETSSNPSSEPSNNSPSKSSIKPPSKTPSQVSLRSRSSSPSPLSQKKIKINLAWTVLCDLFLILTYDSVYDSRLRTLLMRFGEALNLSSFEICQFERRITEALEIDDGAEQTLDESAILRYRAKKARRKRMVYIGLAGVGGSLILGVSGGLLGPLIGAGIAAGLSTVGIAGTSGFLAGAAGTAIVTTVLTGIGAKVGATGMMRRTGAVKTFEFRPLHNNKRLNLIVTVSGWMNSVADDIRLPFLTMDPAQGDLYSLLWEPEMLTTVGQTINILATEILTQSVQQILGATVLTALMLAIQVPMALLKLGYLLDNPWNVLLDRAWAAGLVLADTLILRNLGVRPVTLVGFLIGSRLIYLCLLELARKGAFDLVENVVIFGAPFVCKADELSLCRSVVSGRFINGFLKKDWILGYLFRATSGGIRRVVGLSEIEGIEGIENFDCTPYVTGHMDYRKAMPKLMGKLGWNVLSEEFIEIDEPDAEQTELQRELVLEFDKNAQEVLQDKNSKFNKRGSKWANWFKPKKKEWWEVYAEGQREEEAKKADTKTEDPETKGEPEKVDPNAEYVFDVAQLKKEIEQMKETGELQEMNAEIQHSYERDAVDKK